jgi:hypothetical protein
VDLPLHARWAIARDGPGTGACGSSRRGAQARRRMPKDARRRDRPNRRPKDTARPEEARSSQGETGTCEPSNCSSGTRSSKARYGTSASRSMMRSASPNRSSCELGREGAPRQAGPRRSGGAESAYLPPTTDSADKTAIHDHRRKPRGRVDFTPSPHPPPTARSRRKQSFLSSGQSVAEIQRGHIGRMWADLPLPAGLFDQPVTKTAHRRLL